jgi:hypothetical protein
MNDVLKRTGNAAKKVESIKKPGFIIDIRYSREEVPGTVRQRYNK